MQVVNFDPHNHNCIMLQVYAPVWSNMIIKLLFAPVIHSQYIIQYIIQYYLVSQVVNFYFLKRSRRDAVQEASSTHTGKSKRGNWALPSLNVEQDEGGAPVTKCPKVQDARVELIDNIGKLLKSNMEPEEPERIIRSLTTGQKFHLLKNHFKPGPAFVFPTSYMAGCNRPSKLEWRSRFPWLVYTVRPWMVGSACLVHCFARSDNSWVFWSTSPSSSG